MRDLLSENGSIFVHCDWHVNFYVRALLNDVFGQERFVNEIIWDYYNKMQGNVKRFAANHDTIMERLDAIGDRVERDIRERLEHRENS